MATPSTETAAEKARQVADTRHPLYKGAAAASRTPEHHRDEQVAPPASPSDPPAAADSPGISHDIDVRQQAKCAAVAPAAIPASEHRRDEQAAPPGLPRDQPAATRNDSDILREATRSPENDRGGQTDTTTNDLEDKPTAASPPGDAPDRSGVAGTSVASGRDSAQDSDAKNAGRDPDTGHSVDKTAATTAGATATRASEHPSDEQVTIPASPSDQPIAADSDGPGVSTPHRCWSAGYLIIK